MQQGYANNRYIIAKSHISYLRALKKTGWETCPRLGLLELGRQDSTLRPSAPKEPARIRLYLRLIAISRLLRK